MTREQQELEALKKMLETDGWRIFHREHLSRLESLKANSWESIKTLEQLNYMRGELAILTQLVNYDKLLQVAEESLTENNADTI